MDCNYKNLILFSLRREVRKNKKGFFEKSALWYWIFYIRLKCITFYLHRYLYWNENFFRWFGNWDEKIPLMVRYCYRNRHFCRVTYLSFTLYTCIHHFRQINLSSYDVKQKSNVMTITFKWNIILIERNWTKIQFTEIFIALPFRFH